MSSNSSRSAYRRLPPQHENNLFGGSSEAIFSTSEQQQQQQQRASVVLALPSPGGGGGSGGGGGVGKQPKDQRLLPKRTTKVSQKLALFPGGGADDDLLGLQDGSVGAGGAGAGAGAGAGTGSRTAIDQLLSAGGGAEPFETLPHVARRIQPNYLLTKQGRKWLPRVTAYCTAGAYRLDDLQKFLVSKKDENGTNPKRFDEALYTTYTPISLDSRSPSAPVSLDILGLDNNTTNPSASSSSSTAANGGDPSSLPSTDEFDTFFSMNVDASGNALPQTISYSALAKRIAPFGECFFFDYGVVVMWGLTEQEEKTVLRNLRPFEDEKLKTDNFETEEFHFHYNTSQQPRIYNDVITLKNPASGMIKLTISHAIAQSVKLALFEELIENTIENTRSVPRKLADTGNIHMTRRAINQKIGQLFIMRINVNLVSNVLDTPEIFWSEPALEPLYSAIRKYLEISQRVELLNQRVAVISDLLDMLKDNLNSTHGEKLEWIVIILIAFEIIIGIAMISVDFIHTKPSHS